jgi:BirA family biotin operon repressor/biotin-[acetyl-CoA-carboxylase] ligase
MFASGMQATRKRILAVLADGPATGPELAEELDISRAAVWKHVEALRELGFEIESADGYTLDSIPTFGGAAVEFGLDAPFDIEFHETIDSTNARARELARTGRDDVVVLADEQTGGRGRLERTWASPSGGIWLSTLIRPDVPATEAPIYTLAAAVATARAVRAQDVNATIKWPNDVLVGDRKLAGILTEMEGEADRISWLVIGIGVNANVDAADLPEGSTSIHAEVGDIDRRELTQALLEEFHDVRRNTRAVIPAWRELSSTLGQRVRVESAGDEIVGEAIDVEYPGTLTIDTADGERTVAAGDCEHLRPVN